MHVGSRSTSSGLGLAVHNRVDAKCSWFRFAERMFHDGKRIWGAGLTLDRHARVLIYVQPCGYIFNYGNLGVSKVRAQIAGFDCVSVPGFSCICSTLGHLREAGEQNQGLLPINSILA